MANSRQLVVALLVGLVAAVAARELQQATVQASVALASLPRQLQRLNARLTTLAASAAAHKKQHRRQQASMTGMLSAISAYQQEEEEEEEPYKASAEAYYEPEEPPAYEAPDKQYSSYEPKDYSHESEAESYSPGKVTVKLFEKFRSELRPQPTNPNTFQFTSELTCTNPKKAAYAPYHEEGIMAFPIVTERMALVTVGVCEWTVTLVTPHEISETATLKGNTNVVCSFTEEAERRCKYGDVLDKGLTISGQGLVYNFAVEPAAEEPAPVPVVVVKPPAYPAKKDGYAKTEAAEEEAVAAPAAGLDVYLNLITGVVNRGKNLQYDNGALQYFFGAPAAPGVPARNAELAAMKKGDPTGEYTLVFKK